ncbi:MAG: hypothetical protein HLX50_18525 [Alteromonadaceae bacterium]|nr:hypothetical protein [Alteromonadaceae bacterium]
MNLFRLVMSFLVLSGCSYADVNGMQEEHRYISGKIAAFGEAVERCEKVAANREAPPQSLINKLNNYELENVRTFLITLNAQLAEDCQKPELTELAYAIGVLEGAEVTGKPKQVLENIKPLVFGKETWGLKERYMQLPENMRKSLGQEEYFEKPFRDIEILNVLESGNPP